MMPTQEEGHAAHLRGQDDAIAGLDRGLSPWQSDSTEQRVRVLAACYSRGYNYGRQVRLQRLHGNPPTPTA